MPNTAESIFAPIRRQNLAEMVIVKLRKAITCGEIAPNSPLAEPVLAEQFGVSRSPIRECLIQLEREGLIYFDARGRTRVCAMNPEDFVEIASMRVALESMGAHWASRNWTAAHTAAVERNIAAQEAATTVSELSALDVELHAYIMQVAGHRRLLAAWLVIRPQLEMFLAHIHRVQRTLQVEPRDVTVQAHRKLLSVIAERDPENAERAMKEHVASWAEWLPAEFRTQAPSPV